MEKDTITLTVGGESYPIGSIEKPWVSTDLGNFLIEVGTLLKLPLTILEAMAEVEDA